MAGGRSSAGPLPLLLLLLLLLLHRGEAFNLDVERPYVFSGPQGSYFGFSVDFFKTQNNLK